MVSTFACENPKIGIRKRKVKSRFFIGWSKVDDWGAASLSNSWDGLELI
jgi:hypothetical protein